MARRGRPCLRISLDEKERVELERRVRATTSMQREAQRARIILACAEGGSLNDIANRTKTHSTTVQRWRSRFVSDGLKGLEDKPRAGHKPTFGSVTRAEIVALACEPIEYVPMQDASVSLPKAPLSRAQQLSFAFLLEVASANSSKKKAKKAKPKKIPKDGKTRRTIEDVRQEAIDRGIVKSIGWGTVQRILAEADVRPHLIQGWVHSPDPKFREKVTEITELYLNPPPSSVVLCIDEKPGMQALERLYPDKPPGPGRKRRREFEYKRHGTQTLISSFEVHTGKVLAHCGDTRKADDLVAFMEEVALEYPTGTVHVVWDNLNIHYDGKPDRWKLFNQRHGNRFVFHYTPKHASWVNQVELFFSIVERVCLRHGSFASKEELRAAVLEFIAYWNREKAHPFKWTFTGYPLQSGVDIDEVKAAAKQNVKKAA